LTDVFVSIGSNVEPERHIRAALDELARRFGRIECSRVYRSVAEGFDGDDFLNLVVAFETDSDVFDISRNLRAIEEICGRERGGPRFAPRTMDLDLLLFGDLVAATGRLKIPRPELLDYAFVLGPLAEIAGDRRHPVTGRSFAEHWAAFPAERKNLEPVEVC